MTHALKELGNAAAGSGWRAKVADRAAPPVAKRTPASEDAVRAVIGFTFLALTLAYLTKVLRRFQSARTT